LIAGARLNLDEQGESLPTLVRIYQLKGTGRLEGAEFDQLYRQPKETFGEDLLQADEVVLSPGQSAHRRMERDKLAKAIAVVPLVRRPAGLSWRTAVELPSPDQRAELRFLIEEYRVERR
jgi:type VI secretion system protein VasD